MNAKRRQELVKAQLDLTTAQSIIEDCQNQEQEAYDNLSESLQSGEKGETMQAAADALQEAVDELQSAAEAVQNAIDNVDEATQ